MYEVRFPAQTNQASFTYTGQLNDDQSGALIDLTLYAMVFSIRDKDSKTDVLTSQTSDGSIVIYAGNPGIFTLAFAPAQMGTLFSKTYDVHLLVTGPDGTARDMIVGTLTIVDP